MRRRVIGIIAGVVIALAGAEEASAANGWEIPLNTTTTVSSQTDSSVSISIGSGTVQADLDAANASTNPDEAGKVLSQTATITVGNTDGYTVYVSGVSNLTGIDDDNHVIPSVRTSKTLGEMSNEWGYYAVFGDNEASFDPSVGFKAMTYSRQSVGAGESTTNSVTKKLTLFYGARVDDTIAEDFYGNLVRVSVVAKPKTVTSTVKTFGGITTMQAMTVDICNAAKENDTAYLRDTRNGKSYWVTKLKDGNCWMNQNLALDLSTGTALTSATSDVSNNWTPGRTTVSSVATSSMTLTETYSWNFGNYLLIDPTITTMCADNNVGLSACSGQFMAVGSRTPSTDPNFYKNSGGKTYTSTEYDAHYLAGNYYQWNAATAGTGGEITDTDATGSICPKNWKLPKSGSMFNNTKGSFYYLLNQYGLGMYVTGTYINDYNIALSPLFFVRGGHVASTSFFNAGQVGDYWSSRAYTSGARYAYALHFYASGVMSSSNHDRFEGYSVRCVVPTS